MATTTTPYNEFQTINNALALNNGPWTVEAPSPDVKCGDFSAGRSHYCWIMTSDKLSFTIKHIANISILMSEFGNADNLDFVVAKAHLYSTLRYNYYYGAEQMPVGTTQTLRVTVGSWSEPLDFTSMNYGQVIWIREDDGKLEPGEPLTQSGTTSILKSPDGWMGYIPITIEFSFSRPFTKNHAQAVLIGRTFSLRSPPPSSVSRSTTRTSASTSSTSSSTSSSSSNQSIVSESLSSLTTRQPISSSVATDALAGPSSYVNSSTSNGRISKARIIGGVVGGLALLAAVAVLLILVLKRKRREFKEREEEAQARPAMVGIDPKANILVAGNDEDRGDDDQSTIRSAERTTQSGLLRHSLPSSASSESANDLDDAETASSSISLLRSLSQSRLSQPAGQEPRPRDRRSIGHEGQRDGDNSSGGQSGHADQRRQTTLASGYSNAPSYDRDVPPPAYSDVSSRGRRA
ncbi:hypothetical protein FRC17_007809 [Serendipita sp. 399]|nr:hypothetical protein FRC17_007809 [Serendipita sp. 399]